MIQLTEEGFKSFYDIDQMLYNDTIWLSKQVSGNVKEFEKTAKQMELGQKEWDIFWKRIRAIKSIMNKDKRDIETYINGKKKMMTKDEFEFAEFYLGEAEEESNCCSASVVHDRCSDCKENCTTVYVFEV